MGLAEMGGVLVVGAVGAGKAAAAAAMVVVTEAAGTVVAEEAAAMDVVMVEAAAAAVAAASKPTWQRRFGSQVEPRNSSYCNAGTLRTYPHQETVQNTQTCGEMLREDKRLRPYPRRLSRLLSCTAGPSR